MSDTLLGVIVGGVLATLAPIVVEVIRTRREADLDKAKRADDRKIDRDNAQRATLLELQVALAEFIRAEGRANHFDVMTLRRTGDLAQYPEGMSDELFATNQRVALLADRSTDARLRELIDHLRDRAAAFSSARVVDHGFLTEARLMAEMSELGAASNAARKQLGEVLRTLL